MHGQTPPGKAESATKPNQVERRGLSWTLAVFYVTLFAMGYGQKILDIEARMVSLQLFPFPTWLETT